MSYPSLELQSPTRTDAAIPALKTKQTKVTETERSTQNQEEAASGHQKGGL